MPYLGEISYEAFKAAYINKINPATQRYWMITEAAMDAGISPELAQSYVGRAQTANAIAVGAIIPEDAENEIIRAVEAGPGEISYAPGYVEGLVQGLQEQGIPLPVPEAIIQQALIPPVESQQGTTSPAPSGSDVEPITPPIVEDETSAGPVNVNIGIPEGIVLVADPRTIAHPPDWVLISAGEGKAIYRDPHSGIVYTVGSDGNINPPVNYTDSGAPIVYYNKAGKPYTNEDQSFWKEADGQWRMGEKDGSVTLLAGAPWASSGISMLAIGIGTFLLLKGLIK